MGAVAALATNRTERVESPGALNAGERRGRPERVRPVIAVLKGPLLGLNDVELRMGGPQAIEVLLIPFARR
ncbi:MAG: hypothetical protein J0I06_07210 [Planctomycetes bacterium]|nr:hypothetical protein [Planctomycetota bacterium]